jgi:hypothetical protein
MSIIDRLSQSSKVDYYSSISCSSKLTYYKMFYSEGKINKHMYKKAQQCQDHKTKYEKQNAVM